MVHAHGHAAHRQVVGFQQVHAARRCRRQGAHRGFQVVHAVSDHRASVQAQSQSRDVLVGVIGQTDQSVSIQNAGAGRDAHRTRRQRYIAHGHIGGRHEARSGGGTRALQHAGGALRDAAGAGQHVYAATDCARAAGENVGCASQTHAARSQHAHVAAATGDVSIDRDVGACAQPLDQHIAAAVGADGGVVSRRCAVVERDRAGRRAQHNISVAAGGTNVALHRVRAAARGRAGVAGHAVHAQTNVTHDQGIRFKQVNAAVACSCAERRYRGFQVIRAVGYGRACSQAQGAGCNVLVAVVAGGDPVGIQDAARRGGDAHLSRAQLNITHRHIGRCQQARGGARARAHNQAGDALRDRACARLHIDAAAAGRRTRRANVSRARKRHAARGNHADIATAADDVGVGRDVAASALRLDQDIACAVGAYRDIVRRGRCSARCRAIAQRDRARRRAQHNGAIGARGRHIALRGIGHSGSGHGAVGLNAADHHFRIADAQIIGLQNEQARSGSARAQDTHCRLQVIDRTADGAAGTQPQLAGQHIDIDVVGARDQRICIHDPGRPGSDAHPACDLQIPHGHALGRPQTRLSLSTRAQQFAAVVLGDRSGARYDIDGAAGGTRAAGLNTRLCCAGKARQHLKGNIARGQQTDIAAGADDIGLDHDIGIGPQGLQEHIARAMGNHGIVVVIANQRDAAGRAPQDDVSVVTGTRVQNLGAQIH